MSIRSSADPTLDRSLRKSLRDAVEFRGGGLRSAALLPSRGTAGGLSTLLSGGGPGVFPLPLWVCDIIYVRARGAALE